MLLTPRNSVNVDDLCSIADSWKEGSSPVVLALLSSHVLLLPNGPGTMLAPGATGHGRRHQVAAPTDTQGERLSAASSSRHVVQPPPFRGHCAAEFISRATSEPAQETFHRPVGGRPLSTAHRRPAIPDRPAFPGVAHPRAVSPVGGTAAPQPCALSHETPRILQRRSANQGSGQVRHPNPGESRMEAIERARSLACPPPGAVTAHAQNEGDQIRQGHYQRDQEGQR